MSVAALGLRSESLEGHLFAIFLQRHCIAISSVDWLTDGLIHGLVDGDPGQASHRHLISGWGFGGGGSGAGRGSKDGASVMEAPCRSAACSSLYSIDPDWSTSKTSKRAVATSLASSPKTPSRGSACTHSSQEIIPLPSASAFVNSCWTVENLPARSSRSREKALCNSAGMRSRIVSVFGAAALLLMLLLLLLDLGRLLCLLGLIDEGSGAARLPSEVSSGLIDGPKEACLIGARGAILRAAATLRAAADGTCFSSGGLEAGRGILLLEGDLFGDLEGGDVDCGDLEGGDLEGGDLVLDRASTFGGEGDLLSVLFD
mmetsp:Transcript_18276/g.36950  ORF Transcript_18276/g.36950 Transcript_18276/m.36950 type:complete len:316 (+) Transcript_18276:393-1340(+)